MASQREGFTTTDDNRRQRWQKRPIEVGYPHLKIMLNKKGWHLRWQEATYKCLYKRSVSKPPYLLYVSFICELSNSFSKSKHYKIICKNLYYFSTFKYEIQIIKSSAWLFLPYLARDKTRYKNPIYIKQPMFKALTIPPCNGKNMICSYFA